MKNPVASFQISACFKIAARGIVLAGTIKDGYISIGDTIVFSAFDQLRRRKIIGIESIRSSGPIDVNNTGILIRCENEAEMEELRQWEVENYLAQIFSESD
ncbi:MAG: hypothetical protein MI810_01690 [Flavobacteriales bacterium]|nr:hypothetical protein [Flavobacteriales bacterium]